MFGLGMGEILLIAVVALLALGPEKLPQAAKALGKGIRDFRRQTRDLRETLERDTQVGDAMRELRSAFEDDPLRQPVKPLSSKSETRTPVIAPAAGARPRPEAAAEASGEGAAGDAAPGDRAATPEAAEAAGSSAEGASRSAEPSGGDDEPPRIERDESAHG